MEKNLGHATAYGYAKSKGYSGTEEEFAELMADYASVGQSAAQSAEQAAASATSASGSAAAASQAAQIATDKASEAVTAASTATTKASEASQSASTASNAATFAGMSAQTATTAAATATTKASKAAASEAAALSAKTDAESARDAAAQSASEAAASAASIDPETLEHRAYGAYVVESASGTIASFADGADDIPMKDVLVHIEPVQEGSGDPSPDNVRPISGWTAAKVTRTGKNYLRLPTIEEINNADKVVEYNSIPIQLEPNTTYYLSTTFLNGYTAKDKGMYCLITPTADRNEPWGAFVHSGDGSGKKDGTLTTGDSGMLYLRFFGHNKQRIDDLYANAQIQLEKGSTATSYEPYSGQTYDITFPSEAGTVYGGTLDVSKGELVVDRVGVVLDGSNIAVNGKSDYEKYIRGVIRYGTNLPAGRYNGSSTYILADKLTPSYAYTITIDASQTDTGFWVYPHSSGVFITMMRTDFPDIVKMNAWLAENTPTICYELVTPITYHLTPQEITSLLGTNNVWADTGDSDVEYRADTKLYITKKITEAVSALS